MKEIDNILEGYHLKQYDLLEVRKKLLVLLGVSGSFELTETANEKLNYILGHSIARDFPKTEPTKQWGVLYLTY